MSRHRDRRNAAPVTKPSVLCVYYTYTQQTLTVMEAMAGVFRDSDYDVTMAAIGYEEPRYSDRFASFPMPHPLRELLGVIPAQVRRRPATIRIPDEVTATSYDLVVVGAPTWWLSTDAPMRAFLGSDASTQLLTDRPFAAAVCCRRYWRHNLKTVKRLGTARGGEFLGGVHFRYDGGQVRSLLSLISYLGSGDYRERFAGVRIPRTNLQDHHLAEARTFAEGLVHRPLTTCQNVEDL